MPCSGCSARTRAGRCSRTRAVVWLTTVIAFGLLYWKVHRGGPAARASARDDRTPDFRFSQMDTPELADEHWRSELVDYLYVAFTNSAAFSPTDTMPMTRRAKAAMAVQSGVSLTLVVLAVARAVGILM